MIAVILTAALGLIFVITGATAPDLATSLLGVVLLLVALAAYLTTFDRIKRRDYAGAKGPLLTWGAISIVLAAVIGALLFSTGSPLLFLSFGEFFAGILFVIAHSSIIPPTPPPTGTQVQPPRPITPEAGTEMGRSGTQVIGIASLQAKTGADAKEANNIFQIYRRGITSVGRGVGNMINLKDMSISRTHAEISYDGSNFTINDLGSKYGTYVDGTAVPAGQPRGLRDGAQIKLGEAIFVFTMQDKTRLAS